MNKNKPIKRIGKEPNTDSDIIEVEREDDADDVIDINTTVRFVDEIEKD